MVHFRMLKLPVRNNTHQSSPVFSRAISQISHFRTKHCFPINSFRLYLVIVSSALFTLMIVSGLISNLMLTIFPPYESILRVIGAIYILWLARNTLKATYSSEENEKPPMDFKEGFILQYINPKVILFGMTLYASYLSPITSDFLLLFLSAVVLAARGFLINSTWVLFGAGIRRYLSRPVVGKTFNIFIAVMLVYNAADLLGLPDLLVKTFA